MPKPYMIGIEVEEVALGLVLRKLNALPGIVALHMDFTNGRGPGRPPKSAADESGRKPRGTFGVTGEEAIIGLLRGGKTLSIGQIRDAFAAQGRSPKSISSVMHKLKQSGKIVRKGPNAYALKTKAKTSKKQETA